MKIRPAVRLGTLWALIALATPGIVRAQTTPPPSGQGGEAGLQPYRGLFGGNEPIPNTRETLDLSASFFGGYDDNVGAAVTGQPSLTKQGSPYWGTSATLTYLHDGPRWDVGTTVSGNGRWYNRYPDMNGIAGAWAFGATYAWSSRTDITVGQSVQYSPYYAYGLFTPVSPPGLGQLPGYVPGLTVVNVATLNLGTQVSAAHQLTSRSAIQAQYSFTYSDFQTSRWPDVTGNYVGGRYIYRLNNYSGVRAGYAYNRGRYGAPLQDTVYHNHIIDAGLDYSRTLPLSRHTTFGFSMGSAILTDAVPGQTDSQFWFAVIGSVNLQHTFLRSWSTGVGYNRNVNYNPGLAAPVFADSVSAELSGHFNDRVRSRSGLGFSYGTVGVGAAIENKYSTTSAYTGLQYAFSEKLAAEVRYYYYYYDFANRAYLPIGVAQQLSRNGAEASLTLWLPIVTK